MAFVRSRLPDRTQEVPVEYAGQKLNLVVYPDRLTLDLEEELRRATEDENKHYIVGLLMKLLASWDAVEDEGDEEDGNFLPITDQTLGEFSLPALIAVSQRVMEEIVPNPERKTSSSGSFGPPRRR